MKTVSAALTVTKNGVRLTHVHEFAPGQSVEAYLKQRLATIRAAQKAQNDFGVEESRRWLLAHLPHAAPAGRIAPTGRTR